MFITTSKYLESPSPTTFTSSSTSVFNAVPTCLNSLATPELAQAACVSTIWQRNVIDGAVIALRQAMTCFYDFFAHQEKVVESTVFEELQIEANCTLEDVWIGGNEKRSGIISLLMELEEGQLQALKQHFCGERLPLGLEDIFQVVEAKKKALRERTIARVQRNSVITLIQQRGIVIPGHDLMHENRSVRRIEPDSGRRRCVTPQSGLARS